MFKKVIDYLKNIKNKKLLTLIYVFLFFPFFIGFIINKSYYISKSKIFLNILITIITILSFSAIISVYYYNFKIKKYLNAEKYKNSNHLFKIFICYFYIIIIFANLFYMAQYAQNINNELTNNYSYTQIYFRFTKDIKISLSNIELFVDCLYLSITTITTIGYGEVIPGHIYGKFLIATEAMIGQIMWGLSITLWFAKKTSDKN